MLQEMFGGIVVDGSYACAPGEEFGGNDEEGFVAGASYDGDDCDTYASTATSSYVSKKTFQLNRATASTPTIVLKHSKNPMVKVMHAIHATLKNNCKISENVMLGKAFRRTD